MWVPDRSSILTRYVCFNSIVRDVHGIPTPYRVSADPMVSTFAINRFNDAIDNFLGNSRKKLFGSVVLFLSQNFDQTQVIFVENHFVVC